LRVAARFLSLAGAALILVCVAAATGSGAETAGERAPHVESATSGSVTATLSWRGNFAETKNFRLAIDRAGVRALDTRVRSRECPERTAGFACPWPAGDDPLELRDLDGDGEPEAIVAGFTGGAHCCVLAIVYRWNGAEYVVAENNFRDPGYRLVDLDRDGRFEFRSADARFAYLYGSFAESVFPVQIVRFDGGRFLEVTGEFPDTVDKDLRRVRREYRQRASSRRHLGVRSALAAYVADLYQLDRGRAAKRTLRSALRRGLLEPDRFTVGPDGRKFIRNLKRHLRRWGYIG
jgi:hypothetical protein